MCFWFPVVAGFWVCFTIDLLSRLFLPFFQRVLDWCLAPLFLVYFFKAARMARIYNKGTTHWNVVLPAYNLQGGMVFDRRSSSSSSSTSSRHHQDMIDNKKQRLYDHPDFYLVHVYENLWEWYMIQPMDSEYRHDVEARGHNAVPHLWRHTEPFHEMEYQHNLYNWGLMSKKHYWHGSIFFL